LLDTCFTNTSTLEATFGGVRPQELGMPPVHDKFSPWEVPTINATMNGWHIFEDCLGVCRFNINYYKLIVDALNAATDLRLSIPEAIKTGKRIVNILRVFNIKNGLTHELETPCTRYGSIPIDGPISGIGVMKHWNLIKEIYYRAMEWDPNTGRSLTKTLKYLGLEDLIPDLEGMQES
jgi:aldehyde:ferredoxin oxidoreductase